jgi:hypothetical protein
MRPPANSTYAETASVARTRVLIASLILSELRTRPLRSQCCYLRREPGSHRPRCIADSGFDTESDLLLAILRFP